MTEQLPAPLGDRHLVAALIPDLDVQDLQSSR
jgi:hypothetical protein